MALTPGQVTLWSQNQVQGPGARDTRGCSRSAASRKRTNRTGRWRWVRLRDEEPEALPVSTGPLPTPGLAQSICSSGRVLSALLLPPGGSVPRGAVQTQIPGCRAVSDAAGLGRGARRRVSAGSRGAGGTPGEARPQAMGPQPWVLVGTTPGSKTTPTPFRIPDPDARRAWGTALACLKPPGLQGRPSWGATAQFLVHQTSIQTPLRKASPDSPTWGHSFRKPPRPLPAWALPGGQAGPRPGGALVQWAARPDRVRAS